MRPLKLTIVAFGPFKGKIVIDFSLFGDEGLYLVSGATGAGKTTLFDALSYALFGVTTAEEMRDAQAMRCQWASDDVQTSVELVFSEKGKVYTIKRIPSQKRPKKRGDGYIVESSAVELLMPDGNVYTKSEQVNRKVVEIVGMTGGQFAQIVMLAQGKFSNFLVSKTDEKRELFKKIFNTERYGMLQDLLSSKAKDAKEEYSAIGVAQHTIVRSVSVDEGSALYEPLERLKNSDILLPETKELLEAIKSESEKAYELTLDELNACRGKKAENASFITKWQERENLRVNLAVKNAEYEETLEKLRKAEAEASSIPLMQKRKNMLLLELSELGKARAKYDEVENILAAIDEKRRTLDEKRKEADTALEVINDETLELESAEKEYGDLSRIDEELDSANECNYKLKERLSAFDGLGKSIGEYEEVGKSIEKANAKLSLIVKSIEEKEKERRKGEEEREDAMKRAEALENAHLEVLSLETHLGNALELEKVLSSLEEKQKEEKLAQSEIERALRLLNEKRNAHSEIITSYYLSGAYSLAKELEEGKPCPVCGSLHHPSPASSSGKEYTREDLEKAAGEERKASDELQSKMKRKERISASIEMLRTDESKYKSVLPGEFQGKGIDEVIGILGVRLEKAKADATERDDLLKREEELEKKLSLLLKEKSELEIAESSQKATILHLETIYGKLEKETSAKASDLEIELEAFQEAYEKLGNEKNSSDALIAALKKGKARAGELQRKIGELQKSIEELKERKHASDTSVGILSKEIGMKEEEMGKLLKELPFETREDAERRRSELEEENKRLESTIDSLSSSLNRMEKEKAALEGSIKEIKVHMDAIPEYDIGKLRKEEKALEEREKELDARHSGCIRALGNIKDALERYQENEGKESALREKWAMLQELSDIANGTLSGGSKISLETYVQTRYLDRILRRANGKLLSMTDGQYEMERSGRVRNMSRKMGLDIDVMDHFTCKTRPVSTLSGGETFKASLALALGLSEEIQASAGAVKIETMFVDEGFGTLDEDSLRSAVSTLSHLAEKGRLVGVISHVAELKENIGKQIIVEKSRLGGSTLRVKTDS